MPLIDAVPVLETARLVAGDAIGSVLERGTLMFDRFVQDAEQLFMHALPLVAPQSATGLRRVYARTVQDLRGIEIAHSGQNFLVQQGHFDCTAAGAEPGAELGRGNRQGVRPEALRPVEPCELFRRYQPYDA